MEQAVVKKKEKEFNPHVVLLWGNAKAIAVREFSFKEDAESLYEDAVQAHAFKVVLAKVVKSHGEG